MLSASEYAELKNKYDIYHAELDKILVNGKNSTTPEDRELLPPSTTNEETSAIEVYEFVNDPPEVYFAYVSEEKGIITTWMGDKLGNCKLGKAFQSNLGDKRKPIWVTGINGKEYFGYYFFSAGDYCRIKQLKNS